MPGLAIIRGPTSAREILTHLHAVPDQALGAVVLAGGPEPLRPAAVGPLVAELGRGREAGRDHLRSTVVLADSASARWRRIWPRTDRLIPTRGCTPFTGWAVVAAREYDPSGRSYRVEMQARG